MDNHFFGTRTSGGLRCLKLPGSSAAGLGMAGPNRAGLSVLRWQLASCQGVAELMDGHVEFRRFATDEQVPGLEVMEGMRTGAVGCVLLVSSYSMGENPFFAFAIAASLPFGFSAQQQNAWLDKGGGNDAIARLAGPRGLRAFPAGKTGSQMGAWFKRKLGSLSHQQGLKMRIPNWGVKVMAQVGVNEQVLAGREIYLVLDRGAINTAEWTGTYDDSKLGLNRAAHSGRADGGHYERCRFLNFPGQVPAPRQPCKTALSPGGKTQEEAIHQFKPHHLAKG